MNFQRCFLSLFFLCTLALISACQEHRRQFIKTDNNLIRYTGRINHGENAAEIYWPGSKILVKFEGDSLKAYLKDENGKNYFNVVIDDDSLRYIKLDTATTYYTLAAGLPTGEHTIALIKRTEWDLGKTWFYGLETINGQLMKLPPGNKHVIEFFGNSITAGYAIDDSTGTDTPDSTNTNNYFTYAAITARHFKADYICTVKSGIGIMVSWFPLIMPEMYDRLNPADSLSKWNFNQVTPDLVVINLFQNDSWLVNMPEHPSFKARFDANPPDSTFIINAYKSFVEKIRNVYPGTPIICALGPMDATRKDSPWPGYVQSAVYALHDHNIMMLFFPYMNKNGHPRRTDHRIMADTLISFIQKKIGW